MKVRMASTMLPIQQENLLMTISSPGSRSISPMTPSPSREIRGIRLFRAISRKLSRKHSRDELQFEEDGDSRSSSTDSYSSTSAGRTSRSKNLDVHSSSAESGFRSVSPHQMSSSSSDAGSDSPTSRPRHHHSTSAESIRKVFQGLSLNNRSHSCTNTKEVKRKVKNAPKKILRAPVSYTYVKGLSGLPTQRVPRNMTRSYMTGGCGCSMQYLSGLHR